MLSTVLDQIPPDQVTASVTADWAHDARKCHEAIATGAAAPDQALRTSKPGRTILRRWSGYHIRSAVQRHTCTL